MSFEQIEQMVRAANPVPDVAVLAGSVVHRGDLIQHETATTESDEMLLLDQAPDVPTPDKRGRQGPVLWSLNGEQVGDVDEREAHVTSADELAYERHPGRRWTLMAAATIAVLALGLLAVTAIQGPDSVQTDTVPDTPAPSTNPATPTALLPVDSSPATVPATTTSAPTMPALGEEITVTHDLIQFGDRLVGVGSIVMDGGRTYVAAGHFDGVDPDGEGGVDPDGSDDLWWFSPETFVLAAFDDAGVELWRTELDWAPGDMVAVDGELWVARKDGDRTLARIDAADGRILSQLSIRQVDSMVKAFGSVWVTVTEPSGVGVGAGRLVRIDPEPSTTGAEQGTAVTTFAECVLPAEGGYCPDGPAAGADAMWLPLGSGGVAMIDSETNQVTMIPVGDIGHDVLQIDFDGDVAYVASHNQVTSIVDGEVVATANPGEILYVGPIDGSFGVLRWRGTLQVLRADDPMVVETRQISLEGQTGGLDEIDGEAWLGTGRNYNLRRVELLHVAGEDE